MFSAAAQDRHVYGLILRVVWVKLYPKMCIRSYRGKTQVYPLFRVYLLNTQQQRHTDFILAEIIIWGVYW